MYNIIKLDQDNYINDVIIPVNHLPINHIAVLSIKEIRQNYEDSNLTIDEFLEQNPIDDLKSQYKFDIIDNNDLPALPTAHQFIDKAFIVNMTKAKEMQTNSLRDIRNKKLDELDKPLLIAERNNSSDLSRLQAYRLKLLDAPAVYTNVISDVIILKELLSIDLYQFIEE